jgi:hypothetical protein
MASIIKVNDIQNTSGANIINESSNTITIGASGDTVSVPSGATFDVSNATVNGIQAGITEADHWRLTSNFTGSGTGDITANLARVTHDSFSPIGSGMTESSGVFTFPSTGMYLIMAHGDFLSGGSSSGFSSVYIRTTTDNSTYNNRAISWTSIFTASVYGQSDNNQLFNVTNTTTHKVKFGYELNNSQTIEGSTSNIRTHFIFIRLGDSQ